MDDERRFFKESAFLQFRGPGITVLPGQLVNTPVVKIEAHRNDELDIIIELTSEGQLPDRTDRAVPGTIRKASEIIEFRDQFYGDWTGIARGVIAHGYRTTHQPTQSERTVQTFTAQSLE